MYLRDGMRDETTPFIIGLEVDVSCVLFLDHGAGWIKTKAHETSTSEPMINGVVASSTPRGYRMTDQNEEGCMQTPGE